MASLGAPSNLVELAVESLPARAPWELDRLVNWWDMEKFSAEVFYQIGWLLENMSRGASTQAYIDEQAKILGKAHGQENRARLAETRLNGLPIVESSCARIGLRQSVKHVQRLIQALKGGTLSPGEIESALGELSKRIRDEMEDCLFMHIPADRAVFYNKPELFGNGVNAKFKTVQFDVVEAGNCFAAGRGTAVVFHLMRIMEIGVQEFGTKLGVPLANEKNWQVVLDGVNKAIRMLPPKDPTTVKMSQVSSNLYAVKLAWRNEVMHPKDTYTLEEAENLIRLVKTFMEELATVV